MERELNEILDSQFKMKMRLQGKKMEQDAPFNLKLAEAYKKELAASKSIEKDANVEILRINYNEVLSNPENVLRQIAAFTNRELDVDKMTLEIDKDLYHERAGNKIEKNQDV